MGAHENELTSKEAARELGITTRTLASLDTVLSPRVEVGGLYRSHRYYSRARIREYLATRERALADLRGQRA